METVEKGGIQGICPGDGVLMPDSWGDFSEVLTDHKGAAPQVCSPAHSWHSPAEQCPMQPLCPASALQHPYKAPAFPTEPKSSPSRALHSSAPYQTPSASTMRCS